MDVSTKSDGNPINDTSKTWKPESSESTIFPMCNNGLIRVKLTARRAAIAPGTLSSCSNQYNSLEDPVPAVTLQWLDFTIGHQGNSNNWQGDMLHHSISALLANLKTMISWSTYLPSHSTIETC